MAGFKMIRLKFVKTYIYGDVVDKWVQRICQCTNMTLGEHGYSGNNYRAFINNGSLSVLNTNFGTAREGSGSPSQQGFILQLRSGTPINSVRYEARIIVDDSNNLVYGSKIYSPASPDNLWSFGGFLFANNLIMNPLASVATATQGEIDMYSMGANPQKAGEIAGPSHYVVSHESNDMHVYRTKIMWKDTNDVLGLLDNVEHIESSAIIGNSVYYPGNVYERVVVDDTTYVHIGQYMWIPIKDVTEEVIEVTQ